MTATMKTLCYLQLVPQLNRSGQLLRVVAKTVSQHVPRVIHDGAHIIQLELTLPDSAFKPVVVSATIPLEKLSPLVTATVP